MARSYTKEELIEILQKKAKELGRTPKQREVKQRLAIYNKFGSFNKGLEAAGLPVNTKSRQTYTKEELNIKSRQIYTKEELIEILQKKAKELGRVPKQNEVKQFQTIRNYFGSFNKGLEAAGLTVYKKGDYTKEELIKILQQKAKELGRTPKQNEVKQAQTIRNYFGSFNKGLEAAGLTVYKKGNYTKEELIKILQQKAKELGRTPKQNEVKQAQTIRNYFGSFNKGVKAAGLTPNKEHLQYTQEDLIGILQQKAKELGRTPSLKEIEQWGAVVTQFGSFYKGLIAAGLAKKPVYKK